MRNLLTLAFLAMATPSFAASESTSLPLACVADGQEPVFQWTTITFLPNGTLQFQTFDHGKVESSTTSYTHSQWENLLSLHIEILQGFTSYKVDLNSRENLPWRFNGRFDVPGVGSSTQSAAMRATILVQRKWLAPVQLANVFCKFLDRKEF